MKATKGGRQPFRSSGLFFHIITSISVIITILAMSAVAVTVRLEDLKNGTFFAPRPKLFSVSTDLDAKAPSRSQH
jgi:hypothetical protein